MNATNKDTTATPAEAPLFTHDCSTCVFLGRYADGTRHAADLYVHQSATLPTVIARFSSDGPDYCSGIEGSYGSNEALTLARHRAEERGLLTYNVYQAMHYAKPGSPENQQMLQALPGTKEYLAFQALRRGHLEQSQTLMRELLTAERTRATYLTDDLERIEAIEKRLAAMLTALRHCSGIFAYKEATTVTAFFFPVDSQSLTLRDVVTAREVALKWHAGQMWGDLPYIEHLDRVVEELRLRGAQAWQLCAAYLHDVFEDTKCPDMDIITQFGRLVFMWARAVCGKGTNRKERQAAILKQLKDDESGAVWLKLADRLVNVRKTVQDNNRALFKMYKAEQPLYDEVFEREASVNPGARVMYDELLALLSQEI